MQNLSILYERIMDGGVRGNWGRCHVGGERCTTKDVRRGDMGFAVQKNTMGIYINASTV